MRDFKQTLTENSYSRQEELIFADCDRNQRARVASLLSKMATFAGYDYDARGLTHDILYANREIFLISRIAMRIHLCPRASDVLTVTTWENGVRGAHMQRVFEMVDQEERLCVSARSDWILVDPITRKILLPREGLEDLGTRKVVWSDLDGNGHLYSGNYGDIVWDYLPGDLQERSPREFYINYSKEATLGQELRLEGFREGETYRMEGLGPEGTCFTAMCVFA